MLKFLFIISSLVLVACSSENTTISVISSTQETTTVKKLDTFVSTDNTFSVKAGPEWVSVDVEEELELELMHFQNGAAILINSVEKDLLGSLSLKDTTQITFKQFASEFNGNINDVKYIDTTIAGKKAIMSSQTIARKESPQLDSAILYSLESSSTYIFISVFFNSIDPSAPTQEDVEMILNSLKFENE